MVQQLHHQHRSRAKRRKRLLTLFPLLLVILFLFLAVPWLFFTMLSSLLTYDFQRVIEIVLFSAKMLSGGLKHVVANRVRYLGMQ